VGPEVVQGMMPGPTLLAEVLEAANGATEEGSRVTVADVTNTVLKIGLNLNLLCKLRGLDLYKVHLNSSKVALVRAEGHTS